MGTIDVYYCTPIIVRPVHCVDQLFGEMIETEKTPTYKHINTINYPL